MIGALLYSPILPEALKEIGDDLFENGLAIVRREASQVAPVEVKQVERDHHDLSGTPYSFCSTEKSVVRIGGQDDHFTVDDCGARIDMPSV